MIQRSASIPFFSWIQRNIYTAPEVCVILSELKHKIEENNLSEQSYGVPEVSLPTLRLILKLRILVCCLESPISSSLNQ